MILIGMLHHRKDPRSVMKSYAYAAIAKAEGAQLLYFSPRKVDFDHRLIHGFIYENGEWIQTTSRFPDVIYNTGSPLKLSVSSEILNRLHAEIPFTTNSIGNKMRVFERLNAAEEFAHYTLPSVYVHSLRAFFNFLSQFRKIVLKPVNGHKGQDIFFIETVRERYHLIIGTESIQYNFDELRSFVSARMREELYMVQPYIRCRTKSGAPYDFRMHVQKNGSGEWEITAIYPRIGAVGGIVSNINNGGSTNYLVPFLKQEFGDEYFNIQKYLEQFSLQLSRHLDKIQNDCFSESIDELGIDAAIDDNLRIWIYEVNWRPGCPPAFYLELNVVKNMIQYAILLARQHAANLGRHE